MKVSLLQFCVFAFGFQFMRLVYAINFRSCGIMIRKSTFVDGIGVFATRSYKAGEVIERAITPIVPNDSGKSDFTLMDDYVFGHNENGTEYFDTVLGYAMIYNHHENSSVGITVPEKSWLVSPRQANYGKLSPFVKDFIMYAKRDIHIGEEMYSSYGTEKWFNERNIPYFQMPAQNFVSEEALYDTSDASYIPGCPYGLTEVYNGRLYAKERILEGTVIEVARGLIVEGALFQNTSGDIFVWRSLHHHKSMLLLGSGALYRGRNDNEVANVDYSWYPENMKVDRDAPSGVQAELDTDGINAVNSITCRSKMLIQFIANRVIEPNEELFINMYKAKIAEADSNGEGEEWMYRFAEFNGHCF